METKEGLLLKLKSYPIGHNVIIEESYLENSLLFHTRSVVCSLESLSLQMSGHSPITNSRYDSKSFENWCEKNNIKYRHNYHERNYLLLPNPSLTPKIKTNR